MVNWRGAAPCKGRQDCACSHQVNYDSMKGTLSNGKEGGGAFRVDLRPTLRQQSNADKQISVHVAYSVQ